MSLAEFGVVVIGRNEGERLRDSLLSISGLSVPIVYVDSNSIDHSVATAAQRGIEVVKLDATSPLSAARARNAGFAHLARKHDTIRFVQFLDGDCEMNCDWLRTAVEFLDRSENKDVALVTGYREEKMPGASVYNALCDVDWHRQPGETEACGGDFLCRVDAFQEVDGFDELLTAGEDPEFCYRLSKNGWRCIQLDLPMTRHDAAITRFAQWSKRSIRTGYAYAARAYRHKDDGNHYCWRATASTIFWGAALPISMLLLSMVHTSFLWFGLLYVIQFARIAMAIHETEHVGRFRQAFFIIAGKFSGALGVMKFFREAAFHYNPRLIEYK